MKRSKFFIRSVVALLLLTLLGSIVSVFLISRDEVQASETRCTTTGATKFLRFNYVPRTGAGYIENKSIIYIPKEALCQGEFPLYIHLHGNNGRNDVSRYYLPRGTPGGQRSTDFGTPASEAETSPQVGSGDFQSAIETAMRNRNIPGMIFVIPANSEYSVGWRGLDGPALKQAAQQALDSNPETSGLHIRLSSNVIISGHSGAGCDRSYRDTPADNGYGLKRLSNMNPIAVGILDTCVSIYSEITQRYSRSTILLYAAGMAYTGASFDGTTERGGYHNNLQTLGFQSLTTCDTNTYIGVYQAGTTPLAANQRAAGAHFKQYWDTPQLPCAKHPNHNWYGIFATGTDHSSAAGKGLRTLLNITYSSSPPPQTGAAATPSTSAPVSGGPTQQQVSTTTTVPTQTQFTGGATIPLEAPFGEVTSIAGSGGGYIINYTKVLFAFIAGLVSLLALLMLIIAGIQIIIGGTENKNTQAKERIIGALGGIVVLAMGGWILYIINPCFFSFEDTQTCTRRIITQTTFLTISGPEQSLPSLPVGSVANAPPAPRGAWYSPIYNSTSIDASEKTRIRNTYMYSANAQVQPLPSPLPANPIEAMMAVINSQLRVTGIFHPLLTRCNFISGSFMSTYCGPFCNLYVVWILKYAGLPYPHNPGNVATVRKYVLGMSTNSGETVNDHFWYIPVHNDQTGHGERITADDVARSPRPTYSPDRPQAGDIVFFNCPERASVSGSESIAGNDCHIAIVIAANGNSFKWIDNAHIPGSIQSCADFHGRCSVFNVMGFGRLRNAPQNTTDYSSMFRDKIMRATPALQVTSEQILQRLSIADSASQTKLNEWEEILKRNNGRNPVAPSSPETFFAGTALANRLNDILYYPGTSRGTTP